MREATQVGIVGAGPAGLMLAHLLAREGIASIVVEDRSRKHVESRIRAGVLEQGTADLLRDTGLGGRMAREGLVHKGIELRFAGKGHRVDFPGLTGGKCVTVYGQHEVVIDLIAESLAGGGAIHFEAGDVGVSGIDGRPIIRFKKADEDMEIACDFIAGCDGFHGICRQSIPDGVLTFYDKDYPYAWLGILSESHPASEELIYAHHERGFALLSMRSPTLSRLYIQVDPHEDVADWPDARVWEELQARTATLDGGFRIPEGKVLQKAITPMRSFVTEPMHYGRLYLAGDAAHIVPPTGAKGMNLAIADVRFLTEALVAWYRDGDATRLDGYSAKCLRRVWKAQRFSAWMTGLLHPNPHDSGFDRRRQIAELDYVTSSTAAMTSLAENYVGLPFDEVAA